MAVEEGRDCLVFRAKVADQTERYDDMVDLMRKVAKLDVELTVEERSLISLAYKNIIGPRRASWRIINSIQQKEEGEGNEENAHKSRVYKCKIQDELSQICDDVIKLIDQHLIPSSTSTEALVFFYKMKGDCFRYLAEFKFNGERKEVADQALEAYQMASTKATAELPPSHPTRLGLVLNFSVFHYEILNSPERACHMAQEAFGEAIAEIDALPEHAYKDCTLILQLIKDNLTLWTSDMPK